MMFIQAPISAIELSSRDQCSGIFGLKLLTAKRIWTQCSVVPVPYCNFHPPCMNGTLKDSRLAMVKARDVYALPKYDHFIAFEIC